MTQAYKILLDNAKNMLDSLKVLGCKAESLEFYKWRIEESQNLLPKPKYKIGTRYKTRGKHPRICTVVNIHHTYDLNGELIKTRYVSEHEFLGQVVTDFDVPQVTIDMGLIDEPATQTKTHSE